MNTITGPAPPASAHVRLLRFAGVPGDGQLQAVLERLRLADATSIDPLEGSYKADALEDIGRELGDALMRQQPSVRMLAAHCSGSALALATARHLASSGNAISVVLIDPMLVVRGHVRTAAADAARALDATELDLATVQAHLEEAQGGTLQRQKLSGILLGLVDGLRTRQGLSPGEVAMVKSELIPRYLAWICFLDHTARAGPVSQACDVLVAWTRPPRRHPMEPNPEFDYSEFRLPPAQHGDVWTAVTAWAHRRIEGR